MLASALTIYCARVKCSWLFNKRGQITRSPTVLPQGRLPATVQVVVPVACTDAKSIGEALQVDPLSTLLFLGDSTLFLYGSAILGHGRNNIPRNIIHKVHDRYFGDSKKGGYNIADKLVKGATLQDCLDNLPQGREECDKYDYVWIVCNLNAPTGQDPKDLCAENSQVGNQVLDLARRCLALRRVVVVFGGSSALWNAPREWGAMVRKYIMVLRAQWGSLHRRHDILQPYEPTTKRPALLEDRGNLGHLYGDVRRMPQRSLGHNPTWLVCARRACRATAARWGSGRGSRASAASCGPHLGAWSSAARCALGASAHDTDARSHGNDGRSSLLPRRRQCACPTTSEAARSAFA